MISAVRYPRFWPKFVKKGRMRRVMTQHIRAIKSDLGHNLKHRLLNYLSNDTKLKLISLLLESANGQSTLDKFPEGSAENGEDVNDIDNKTCKVNDVEFDLSSSKDTEKCVVIYVRVSTENQKRDGRSIKSQLKDLKSIIESDPEISLYCEPIVDDGESGTDFEREGIMKAASLAQKEEVTHLMIDTIDRIGREIAGTLMYMKQLREQFDVKIMRKQKEFDIKIPEDKMVASSKAMVADFATRNQATSSKRSSADRFLQQKRWCSWKNKSPFGYKLENEDGKDAKSKGWIEKVDYMKPVIEDIYNRLLCSEEYKDVAEHINNKYCDKINKYNRERFENKNDENDEEFEKEDDPITRGDVKKIVNNPVYRGEPMIVVNGLERYNGVSHVDDPELAFVDDDTHRKAQNISAEITDKYSTDKDLTLDIEDYPEEFDPYIIETVSSPVRLVCPDCSSDLIRDGHIETITGSIASRHYKCSNHECEYSERWPKESEAEMMEMLSKLDEYRSLL